MRIEGDFFFFPSFAVTIVVEKYMEGYSSDNA